MISKETRKKISDAAKKRTKQNFEDEKIRQKAITKKQSSPKGGRTETNVCAKEWHIVAPDGKEYKFKNMLNFIRQNHKLFNIEGTDKECQKILARFSFLKHAMKNGKKHKTCCGGWKIILDN